MKNFIKTSVKKLKEAIDNNKLVVFVGAGVSANSKCPSWEGLVEQFADELGIPNDKRDKSVEYFLKIPQYYYIERGEKEYFDLIDKNINNFDAIPNDINRIIFELKPSTIITTNFDDLLEKTVKSQGLFYTTVKQDKDLPYCFNDQLIIKMHGDGKLKNIILKEDDYLSYSRKFPLVENYIKGLFSTKTILFIGYSAEDPDFKLLFKSVKEQLGGDFQPAYLLEVNKDNNRIDYNYYKNRGINILYYSDINNEIDNVVTVNIDTDITHELGKKLYKFLLYIKDYKEEVSNYIDEIYNKISIFEEMNAINPKDIIDAIGETCSYDIFGFKELFFEKNDLVLNFIKDINSDKKEIAIKKVFENQNTKKILNILNKASIENILIESRENKLSFKYDLSYNSDYKESDTLFKLYKGYKYKELLKEISPYLQSKELEGNEKKFLEKAYYLYNLGEYIEAYTILKKLSVHCFSRKKYLYYFISQFNMKKLSIIIKNNFSNYKNNKDLIKIIDNETNNIDIEYKYMELPKQYREKCKFILELNNFNIFYKEIIALQENTKALIRQKKVVEKGGFSFSNDLIKSFHKVKNLLNYIDKNYIMVSHFKEIKNMYAIFIEGILVNYSININNDDNNPFRNANKIDKLDIFIIDIIIRYIKNKDLKEYLFDNKIEKLKVEEDVIPYILDVLDSIVDFVKYEQRINIFDKNNAIKNIISILQYTDIKKDDFIRIILVFKTLLSKNILDVKSLDELLDFIIRIFNRDEALIDSKSLIEFIEEYVVNLVHGNINGFVFNLIRSEKFFNDIVYICNKTNNELKLKINNEINTIIDRCENTNSDEYINNLLIPLYLIMSEEIKNKFEIFISNYCNDIKDKNKYSYIDLMYKLMIKDIGKYDINEFREFIKYTTLYIMEEVEKEKSKKNEETYPIITTSFSQSEEAMKKCIDIIRNKNINYSDIQQECKEIEEKYPMFKFFINKEGFDYSLFEEEWIEFLTREELVELIKGNKSSKAILAILLNKVKDIDKVKGIDEVMVRKLCGIAEELIYNYDTTT